MAKTSTAKHQEPEIVNPLALIEQYATEDLVRQSDEFLAAAGRVVQTWGVAHEGRIGLIVARSADVSDAESYAQVGEWLREGAERLKDAETFFEPRKGLGFKLHRLICDRENLVLTPLRAWMKRGKENWDRFRRQEEENRRAEEQRLANEARRVEQERLAREAELLEQRGESELAEQVLEQALHTPAPVIALTSSLPAVKGVSTTANWKWRPVGGDTPIARARAEKLAPREFLELSEKKLNAYAKAHGASARVPGIEFYDAGSVRVRA
jgi:hypothetical protein